MSDFSQATKEKPAITAIKNILVAFMGLSQFISKISLKNAWAQKFNILMDNELHPRSQNLTGRPPQLKRTVNGNVNIVHGPQELNALGGNGGPSGHMGYMF